MIPREKSDLKEPISDQIWDLACDVAAEWALDESQWYPLESDRRKRRDLWYRMILNEEKGRDTLSCYRWLRKQKKTDLLCQMKEEYAVDCHEYWYQDDKEKKSLERQEDLVKTWRSARQGLSMQLHGAGQRAGRQSGAGVEEYRSAHRKTYDYRKFLKQFAVCREEMQLDMESIDYIPYLYGLKRYENVLLVEPLETTEVNRLEEFVIAIDTSGSCSGEIVCRFLDETDFTPVFRLVDKMLEQKEIRNLKGLLYFTDGDGIFPHDKPVYETAFVFLNRELEKRKIPDWAIRLNLEL